MSKKRSLNPQLAATLRVLSWTGLLIGLLTLTNFLFILNAVGPGFQMDGLKLRIARKLASVNTKKTPKVHTQTPVVEWSCESPKALEKIHTFAPTARLRLKDCPESIKIRNLSNSSQGDLFSLKNGQFTSDFLPLRTGDNEILLEFQEKSIKVVIIRDKEESNGPSNTKRPSS